MLQPLIKKRILISGISSFILFLCFVMLAWAELTGENMHSAGLWLGMIAFSCITAVICLIEFIVLLFAPASARYIISIYLAIHTLVWGCGWLILSIIIPGVEKDLVPFFFLVPICIGALTTRKIIKKSIVEDVDD